MGKPFPRLIGLFPKLKGQRLRWGINTKGEKDQSGRDL